MNELKPLVIFHDHCTDGFGAAFAAWMKFGDKAEYLPASYGKFQWPVVTGRDVYILDFSFSKEETLETMKKANKVIWLDHHKTAFEMWVGGYQKGIVFNNYDDQRRGSNAIIILDDNKSGALLAWEYFHPGTGVPMMIKHIDDRDRWQFKIEGSKEFHAALASCKPWSFEQWKEIYNGCKIGTDMWDEPGRFGETYYDLLNEGSAILRAHEQNVKSVVAASKRKCGIPFKRFYTNNGDGSFGDSPLTPPIEMVTEKEVVEFKEGDETILRAPGLSANCPPHLASDVGHELANESGTFGLCWYMGRDGKAKVSLRSNGDYDVSAIAKSFGGGGHRNAAGFEVSIDVLLGWMK